jgi:hypothetical protein
MELDAIITGCIGIIATFASGFCSWFFTRRKYNSEVYGSQIENMTNALEFYKKLSDDTQDRLNDILERSQAMEEEIQKLRIQVLALTKATCLDYKCIHRLQDISAHEENNRNTKKHPDCGGE